MIQHSTGTIWVGMDVHQTSVTAAILHGDSPEPEVVRLPGELNAARRLFRRLGDRLGDAIIEITGDVELAGEHVNHAWRRAGARLHGPDDGHADPS